MVSSPSSTKKKVFIIGAGPSGLVALKETLEAGHDPLCVDAKKQIGGIFSVSYEELYTTTSNMFMAFSDFPPKEGLRYWTKEEYLQYLEDYVDHFDLRKYIKLNTAVKHCELDEDTSRWKIRTTDWASRPGEMRRGSITLSSELPEKVGDSNNKRASLVFRQNAVPTFTYDADYVIVASGTNQVPRVPDLPNCNAEIIHSADFTNAKSICEGKKVLVIGNGESASDVAAQATDVAEKVTLFSRRDFSLGPRFISAFLKDGEYDERQMLANQDKHDLGPHDMLEGITNSRVFSRLPTAIFSLALDAMLTDVTNLHGEDSAAGILAKVDKKNFRKDFYALDTSAPTKSGGVLAYAVACKGLDIIVSPEVQFIENGDIARFKNVSFMGKDENEVDQLDVEVDTVILCTGFELNFDWINVGKDPIEANPRKWFKHCFPPELGNKIAFLGYARPAQGGIPQCSELLARYVALLLSSERTLPEDYAIQAIAEGRAETETFYATPNATSLVEFPAFSSSVARLIRCEPYLPFLSPSRLIKFWTLPQWVYFYRLNGPGANPDVCWDVVDKFRITNTFVPMPLLVLFFLFGALMQPLMILEYIFGSTIIDCGLAASEALPRFYKWRVGGHFFQLSGNKLRLKDLLLPSFGWLAIELLLFVVVEGLVTHLVATTILVTTYIVLLCIVFLCKKYSMRRAGDNKEDSESGELLQEEGGAAAYGSVV